jgi:hypothetical protein
LQRLKPGSYRPTSVADEAFFAFLHLFYPVHKIDEIKNFDFLFFAFLESNVVGSTLAKAAALRINLNIDGAPITSRTHTHPSHSQTSRLLTSSLSLGVPVPRATQCRCGA